MAIPILNHLDLRSVSELQNAILHKTTTSSASNVEGKLIYDTSSDTLKFYNGSNWLELGTSGGSVTSVAIAGTDGIQVDSGSPITSAGTITLGLSNIANNKLLFSTVSYGGVELALGETDATPAFDLQDATGYPTSSLTGTITNAQLAGSIANAKLANSSITINGSAIALGGSVTTPNDNTQLSTEQVQDIVGAMFSSNTETRIAATYQDSDGTIDLVVDDMTANTDVDVSNANLLSRLANLESTSGAANENITIGADSGDTIVITGNLQVSGTTTTVNSTTVNLNDHNIVLDSGNSTSAVVDGAGITLEGGSGDDATFTYNASTNAFDFKLGSAFEDIKAAKFTGTELDISGNVDVDGTLEADAITINGTATGALALLDTVAAAQIDSNAVTTAKINADAVTGAKIADDAINSEHITDGSVDNVHLAGSIANAKLANSAITIDGSSVSLGGSITTNNTQLSLASKAEVQTGTNTTKAVTPDTLASKSVHATIDVSDSNFTSNLYAEITHSLGSEDVIVQCFDSSSKETIFADVARTDKSDSASTSKIKISFSAAPTNDIEVLITSIEGSTAGSVAYA
jgi:hypothetical protein|tara:strand:+ start:2575 stop:4308 length:1734 start_codon:yes stop_codon:yes gene_type:complete